jgi:hypothetical protein
MIYNNGTYVGMIEDVRADLGTQGEYWYNSTNDKVYVYSTSNPGTYYTSIEAGIEKDIFSIGQRDYIVVRDLDLRYGSLHGITTSATNSGTSSHITIWNNSLYFIGGAYQTGVTRYGNAIQSWCNLDHHRYAYNFIYQPYDAALSPQCSTTTRAYMSNVRADHNVVVGGWYGWEFFNANTSSTNHNFSVDHNTFVHQTNKYHSVTSFTRLSRITAEATEYNVTDNIFYNQSLYAWEVGSGSGSNWLGESVFFDRNYYYGTATYLMNNEGTNYASLAAFVAATIWEDHGYESASPSLFVNPQAGDYRPQEGSPACTMDADGSYVGALPCYVEDNTASCASYRGIFCDLTSCSYAGVTCSESSSRRPGTVYCNQGGCS